MKVSVKVSSLSHDELVTIFADATYGDNTFDISIYGDDLCAENKKAFEAKGETYCLEDHWADQLLNGGMLKVIDNTALFEDGEAEEDCTYLIDLKKVLMGCGRDYDDTKTLLIDEDGDFYTAWNILQTIVLGEVVYG